ncbi:TadE/TadG family type IV pilus assembly protein [Devosia sp. 2618]|uniref:TadE/TadG family type IV pilus assembly protein n=1 Tax=Devosia sp. 2618 TaxID=3156454 RepID=UPI00339B4BF0
MKVLWRTFIERVRQFTFVQEGVAAVEFALILPVMLFVYIGSVEASALITMDRRMQTIAGTVGDLVARSETSIDTATLQDYFLASGGIMTPYPSTDLKQIVTQVLVKTNGTAEVVWSREYSGGKMTTPSAYPKGIAYTLPKEMVEIARGQYVIVSQASYNYLPLYGIVFEKKIQLARENYFIPRFRRVIDIK